MGTFLASTGIEGVSSWAKAYREIKPLDSQIIWDASSLIMVFLHVYRIAHSVNKDYSFKS